METSKNFASVKETIITTGPVDIRNGFQMHAADFNNDGFQDLYFAAGPYLLYGSAKGFQNRVLTQNDIDAAKKLSTNTMLNLKYGIGDINGDGYSDVAVTAANLCPGKAFVEIFLGSKNGFSKDPTAPGAIGDINGDGISDIGVVSCTGGDDSGCDYQQDLRVIFGKKGLESSKSIDVGNNFDIKIHNAPGNLYNVNKVESIGDLNKDGYGDILVQTLGGSYVIFGKPNLSKDIHVTSLSMPDGFKVLLGDYDGNATCDFNNDGKTYLMFRQMGSGPDIYIIFNKDGGFNDTYDLSKPFSGNDGMILQDTGGNICPGRTSNSHIFICDQHHKYAAFNAPYKQGDTSFIGLFELDSAGDKRSADVDDL